MAGPGWAVAARRTGPADRGTRSPGPGFAAVAAPSWAGTVPVVGPVSPEAAEGSAASGRRAVPGRREGAVSPGVGLASVVGPVLSAVAGSCRGVFGRVMARGALASRREITGRGAVVNAGPEAREAGAPGRGATGRRRMSGAGWGARFVADGATGAPVDEPDTLVPRPSVTSRLPVPPPDVSAPAPPAARRTAA